MEGIGGGGGGGDCTCSLTVCDQDYFNSIDLKL